MKKIVSVSLVSSLLLIGSAVAKDQKPNIVIATGGLGGVYYYYGTTVAEILSKQGAVETTAIQTAASIDNMLLVQRRTDPKKDTFYCATVLPDSAYLAYTGQAEKFKDNPAKNVRVMWAMYPNYLHIVTKSGTGVSGLESLKGKRVSTGAPGSGTEVEALLVLDAAGIRTSDFSKQERLGASESAEALAGGTVDAYFWSGGLPTASVTETGTTLSRQGNKMEFVPLEPNGAVVQDLKKRFPGVADPGLIPKEVYTIEKDIPTLAFWNLFVCPDSLPDGTAYNMTKAVFDQLTQLQEAVKPARDTTLKNSIMFVDGTIPYHPGALRYYKEVGALK